MSRPAPNPSGLCICGCGLPTPLAKSRDNGLVIGQPTRYRHGHHQKRRPLADRLVPSRWAIEDRGFRTPCWIWLGAKDQFGYGIVRYQMSAAAGRRNIGVHRISYEHHNGPIPEGYHVHHECEQKPCLNPEHLRLLSASAHAALSTMARVNTAKTHCKHGHEFTPENTWIAGNGSRRCRTCDRATRLRRRSEAAAA